MKRMDRRSFMLVATAGTTGFVLTACVGNDPDDEDLNPTMIPVEGAPPTLAPMATPGGGAAQEGGAESEQEAPAGDAVELEAQDPYNWSTNDLEAAPGQVIRVTNTGLAEHNIHIDELDIAEDLPNGEPVEITLPDDLAVGDAYTYYCSVPGHREGGMEGTLTIVEASAAAPAQEEPPAEDAGATDGGAGGPVTLEAQDPYNWSVTELEAAPGQVIQVTNTGLMEHDFVIDELGIKEPLEPGTPVDVTLPADLAVGDTYTYYCSVPGHRESGMEGTLTIVEGGGGAAPAEGEGEGEAPPPAADEGAASGPVTLEAQDPYNWSVTDLEAAPGQVIEVTNTGLMEHDFVIDELGINEPLPNGEAVQVTLPEDLTPGDTYTYYCSVPGHRESGMEGTLTVVEAGGGAPAPPAEEGGASTPAAEGTAAAAAAPITLEAQDPFQWSSNDISAAPGQILQITNAGLLEHDFVVDELGLDAPLPVGEVVEVAIPDDAPVGDTYEFYCSIPGHRSSGMEGTLTIVEAGGETGAAPAEGTPAPVQASPVSEDVAALMEDPEVVALEATDPYNWSFKSISAYPGQIVRVINLGVLEHDFVIEELDIKQELPFGEPIDIQVPDSVSVGDTYTYYCSIPGHKERGMEGTLTIVEEGADTGPVAVASPAASPAASPVATSGDAVILEAHDPFAWSETALEASAGAVIAITNTGFLEHNFTIDELDIAENLPGGQVVEVTLPGDLAAGDTYTFYCSVLGHRAAGMEGTLTIV